MTKSNLYPSVWDKIPNLSKTPLEGSPYLVTKSVNIVKILERETIMIFNPFYNLENYSCRKIARHAMLTRCQKCEVWTKMWLLVKICERETIITSNPFDNLQNCGWRKKAARQAKLTSCQSIFFLLLLAHHIVPWWVK